MNCETQMVYISCRNTVI